jgi:hypothetical protein
MSEPQPEPVHAGDPVTIQHADQGQDQAPPPSGAGGPARSPEEAQQPGTGTEGTSQGEPGDTGTSNETGPGPVTVHPSAAGQPPGAVVADPIPEGGPGEQSLAERQAAGEQAGAELPRPEAGPGASDSALEPEPVSPPDEAAASRDLTDEEAQTRPVSPATSNESPKLPPNLTSGAAKAHAMLSHAQDAGTDGEQAPEDRLGRVLSIVQLALSELEKFLPDHVRAPAKVEAREAVDRL